MQADLRIRDIRTEVRIPLERQILDAIPAALRSESHRVPGEVKQVGLAQRAFIQRDEDKIAVRYRRADGVAGLLPSLRACELNTERSRDNDQKPGLHL